MFVLDAESLKESKFTISLIIINGVCFLLFNLLLSQEYLLLLLQDNAKILNEAQYWRLFTSMFLHADAFHIFYNMIALLIFGATVEDNYTKIQYVVVYFLSGLVGNIFSLFLLPPNALSLGASGAIFGLIGAAFTLIVKEDKSLLLFAGLYVVMFIISSFGPGINLWAHLFGLTVGIGLGLLINRKRDVY